MVIGTVILNSSLPNMAPLSGQLFTNCKGAAVIAQFRAHCPMYLILHSLKLWLVAKWGGGGNPIKTYYALRFQNTKIGYIGILYFNL